MIENLYNRDLFTNNEYIVVSYMLEHKDELVDMTITSLARNTSSSNTTIIRICRKIGYNGFKEFKKEYIKYNESRKYIFQDFDYTKPFHKKQDSLEVISSMSNLYKYSIDHINRQLNIEDLEKIVDILDKSRNVYVFGRGDSKVSGEAFINKALKIGKFFHLATLLDDELQYAKYAGDNDCCLFISYDQTNHYHECLKELVKKKTKIIVLSASKNNPLVKYSDYHILIPHLEEDEKIATFYSQHAFSYVLNIIYSLLYQKK